MTKAELIAEIAADNPHLRTSDVERVVSTILDGIADAMIRGDRVELRGFGTFTNRRRRGRTARNPRTGEPVAVAEKVVPFFKPGRDIRERINRGVPPPDSRPVRLDELAADD